ALSRAVPMPRSIEFEWTRVEYTQTRAARNRVAEAPRARMAVSGVARGMRGVRGVRRRGHEVQQTQGTAAIFKNTAGCDRGGRYSQTTNVVIAFSQHPWLRGRGAVALAAGPLPKAGEFV